MRKILFLTCFPSPYRVNFFDELGKYAEVTVLFSDRIEDQQHRPPQWFLDSSGGFHSVQLDRCLATVHGERLCTDVISWLKKPWDDIIICGYTSPTMILAMLWLRTRKIPFYLEADGGLIRQDSGMKLKIKRYLNSRASGWLSSGDITSRYLLHYGAKEDAIWEYPFTSLYEKDIMAAPASPEEKKRLRRELHMEESRVVLTVGQFIHRKGFDVLMRAAARLPENVGIYIVGGEPTEEYLQLSRDLGLKNLHFGGFMDKETLKKYYRAADVFTLPTREDIWGLVVEEAMACGLPVITTDRCVAGLQLVEDGENGFLVPVEEDEILAEKIRQTVDSDLFLMGEKSLQRIRPYTIEHMAKVHMEILNRNHLR